MTPTSPLLEMEGVHKRFVLHLQNQTVLDVLRDFSLRVLPGECVRLSGPSGMGKSTVLKLAFGNYQATQGRIALRAADGNMVDITQASPREIVQLRASVVGYVSQFLRVIPRVPAIDVVAEPLLERGADGHPLMDPDAARAEAARWLERLRIPPSLWQLPPATFSGGEQQRINIARSFIRTRPLLLLDEPTASLDPLNTATVIELIHAARTQGVGVVGIFHDPEVAAAVASRSVAMQAPSP
ncbi:MAG: phosphonate C-P lyase system protein PhnL [Betaproteobacteria bacterium]|nr:phosphonate C-P lyase system protein PhnL [Betaproteobacteria bacterium]